MTRGDLYGETLIPIPQLVPAGTILPGPGTSLPTFVYLATGDSTETHFALVTPVFGARANLISLFNDPWVSAFSLGPDLGWMYYHSDLEINNNAPNRVTTNGNHDTSRHSMLVAGAFAGINLGRLGLWNDYTCGAPLAFVPMVEVAGSLGDGQGIRYYGLSATVGIDMKFRQALRRSLLNTEIFYLPTVRTSLTYAYRNYDQYQRPGNQFETLDPITGTTGPPVQQNNNFNLSGWTLSVAFSF